MKNISLILSLVYQLLVVTRKGEVMGAKEYQATGGGNNRLMKNYNKEKESNDLAGSGMVEFSAHPGQKYGFDAYTEQKQAILNNYPTLNNGYRPAFKSVESFGYDKVGVSSREGLTFRDEMSVPAADVGEGVSVRGLNDGSVRALYAYRDGGGKEEIVGKLNVMSFDNRPMRVYIVPVNDAHLPSARELQQTLNEVYRQAVTTWTVVEEPRITISFPGGKMTHGGSGDFSTYNDDQKLIVETYTSAGRHLERESLYLFFVEGVTFKERSIAGFMPLQRQAGFIYDNPGTVTVAHELAHGAFNLRHTFSPQSFIVSEGQTQNLMDYTGGTELWQHQWKSVQDPQRILFAFMQDEKEGEMEVSQGHYITVDGNVTETLSIKELEDEAVKAASGNYQLKTLNLYVLIEEEKNTYTISSSRMNRNGRPSYDPRVVFGSQREREIILKIDNDFSYEEIVVYYNNPSRWIEAVPVLRVNVFPVVANIAYRLGDKEGFIIKRGVREGYLPLTLLK